MLDRLIEFSIRQRVFVLLTTLVLIGIGAWSTIQLPIDAVPDITNVQVQINTQVPALAPEEIEKLVTLPIENVMAGENSRLVAKATPESVRGLGFMIGLELAADIPAFTAENKAASLQFVNLLHEAGLLTIPSGMHVIRLLPALNLRRQEAEEGVAIIESVAAKLT